MTAVESLRWKFADQLRQTCGIRHAPLVEAFATVPRERFLPPGPWLIAQPLDPQNPYRPTPDADLAQVYQDVALAIDPARQLNNGQPSAHARWMDAIAPTAGESVLHIGCGLGYYSAILAEQVGAIGRVVAVDVDPELAASAKERLSDRPTVTVIAGDGASIAGAPFDVIYLNAGATHPRAEWLSGLAEGGRLFLPLTVHLPVAPAGVGAAFRIERRGERWPVSMISPIGIFDCAGARDPSEEASLKSVLFGPDAQRIDALLIAPHPKNERCVLHREGWCLTARE